MDHDNCNGDDVFSILSGVIVNRLADRFNDGERTRFSFYLAAEIAAVL